VGTVGVVGGAVVFGDEVLVDAEDEVVECAATGALCRPTAHNNSNHDNQQQDYR
jgi:hypothetical protein